MSKNQTRTLTVVATIACALITSAHAAMTISGAKTKNVSCTGGVCTPTGSNANLNVGELQTMLASSDVTVRATAVAPTLGVLDSLTWASTHRLTLDSYAFIHVKAPIVVEGTSGLTLITNDGGTGGDYEFDAPGSVTFWDLASSLVINGKSYTLEKDIKTLASDIAANPSGNYALAANYDASADGTYDNAPILTGFAGTFDGLGNQIENFSLAGKLRRRAQYPALFASITGSVRDIVLTNVSIASSSGAINSALDAAALAFENDGLVKNVAVSGTISNVYGAAAGLVGRNNGMIVRASANVSVNGVNAAGLVYVNDAPGTVSQSSANGSVTATPEGAHAGGLVTENYGTIADSHAAASASASFAGGLVARNQQTILRCSATGDVSGDVTGGLAAENDVQIAQSYAAGRSNGSFAGGFVAFNSGVIAQSYAIGAAGGASGYHVGGFAGEEKKGHISQSYSVGAVESNIPGQGGPKFGGFVGHDQKDRVNNSTAYWDLTTSGVEDPSMGAGWPLNDPGITGLTDAQLKSALPAGFDPNVWGQSAGINNGWPYLLANPPQ